MARRTNGETLNALPCFKSCFSLAPWRANPALKDQTKRGSVTGDSHGEQLYHQTVTRHANIDLTWGSSRPGRARGSEGHKTAAGRWSTGWAPKLWDLLRWSSPPYGPNLDTREPGRYKMTPLGRSNERHRRVNNRKQITTRYTNNLTELSL